MANVTEERSVILTEDDVVRKLLEQHTRIRDLFEEVRNASGSVRRELFAELCGLIVVHETAEEMIVRPVVRHLIGDLEPDARDDEEDKATRDLDDMSGVPVDDPEFMAALVALESAVDQHASAEEKIEFPAIQEQCTSAERQSMGRQLDAAMTVAPTRPHPGVTGHETAVLALGPLAALVDRTRDAIRSALR
ncbi:MAG: hemerythrin domain-containing protein [Marmoricola sp.]